METQEVKKKNVKELLQHGSRRVDFNVIYCFISIIAQTGLAYGVHFYYWT